MARLEHRVVWQREGLSRRIKIVQTRKAADRFALVLLGQMEAATGRSRDEYACCNGRECGCRGETLGDVWDAAAHGIPPLIFGPAIEARPVGDWILQKIARASRSGAEGALPGGASEGSSREGGCG